MSSCLSPWQWQWIVLWNGWPTKALRPTGTTVRDFSYPNSSRRNSIWNFTEPELGICWRKLNRSFWYLTCEQSEMCYVHYFLKSIFYLIFLLLKKPWSDTFFHYYFCWVSAFNLALAIVFVHRGFHVRCYTCNYFSFFLSFSLCNSFPGSIVPYLFSWRVQFISIFLF